jgi:hypothetical protein
MQLAGIVSGGHYRRELSQQFDRYTMHGGR